MTSIIHYSQYEGGNASEYIIPRGKIDITSHGLGSGIYGLSAEYLENYPANSTSSFKYKFIIQNPFVLSDNDKAEKYMETSMEISRRLQKYYEDQLENMRLLGGFASSYNALLLNSSSYITRISRYACFYFSEFDLEKTKQALLNFVSDFLTRKDVVELPINYILKAHEFDGVASSKDVITHSWSRGDVKFVNYPKYNAGDKLPVAHFVARKGIERPVINLLKEKYVLQNNEYVLLEQTSEYISQYRFCPFCCSSSHLADSDCSARNMILNNIRID